MKFKITLEDIRDGERGSPDQCPAAICIARTLDVPFNFVWVWPDEIKVYYPKHVIKRPVPPKLAAWVARWDAGVKVSPIEFDA